MLKLMFISLLIYYIYAVPGCSTHECFYYSGIGTYCYGCITCYPGYTLDLNPYYCCLNSYKDKCQTCSNANKCSTCISSYGLNSSSMCELCSNYLSNCVSCLNVNGCTACETGYAVNLTDSRTYCATC